MDLCWKNEKYNRGVYHNLEENSTLQYTYKEWTQEESTGDALDSEKICVLIWRIKAQQQ